MVLLGWPARRPSRTSLSRWDRVASLAFTCPASPAACVLSPIASAIRIALTKISSGNGFSMKSTAPAFIASTASATSACPVMMITGILEPSFLSFLSNCSPSIPGIRTSLTIQPFDPWSNFSRKADADSYTLTANPAVPSRNASARRTCSSSSIKCTTALDMFLVLRRDSPQRQTEYRAAFRIGFNPELAAMCLDNGAGNRQTNTHAVPLRRHERLEQFRRNFGRDARACVRDRDFHRFRVHWPGGYNQFTALDLLHRFQ